MENIEEDARDLTLVDDITVCTGERTDKQYCNKSGLLLSIYNKKIFVMKLGDNKISISFSVLLNHQECSKILLNLVKKYDIEPEEDFMYHNEAGHVFGLENIMSYARTVNKMHTLKKYDIN